jgi:RNA polymerase sigma factor (sigma-70 family)
VEFLREFQDKADQSLSRLVRDLTPALIGFLVGRMGVPEADAEELASDVLFTVGCKIQAFQYGKKAKLTTWIFEIAKNRAIDFHRKSRTSTPEPGDAIHGGRGAESFAGRNHGMLSWLRDEFKKLSQEDQQLLLWRADEIPYAHAAKWLGVSEGTARTRHNRAMAKLLQAAGRGAPEGTA